MKILLTVLLGSLLLIGCQQPATTPTPAQNPSIHVEVNPGVPAVPPPAPQVQPVIPTVLPTRNYLFGYVDGYNGRLVSIRWATFEYRQGHDLGRWDRTHNLPQRFR